jgi:hypothetical protein
MATSTPLRGVEARPRAACGRPAAAVAVPVGRAPSRSAGQLVDRIGDVKANAPKPEDVQLPSLLEEAETLTKSFEALQSSTTSTRRERGQARAARRYFSSCVSLRVCWSQVC